MPKLLKTVLRASAIFAVAAGVTSLFAEVLGDAVAGTPGKFITDRPNFTESAAVAGRGNFHFEYGTTLAHEAGALQFTGPELLVRAGVNKRLEFRFSADGLLVERSLGTRRARGLSDADVGAKLRLREERRFLPEVGILVGLSVPTGSHGFSSLGYDPSMKAAYAKTLPAGFSFGGNVNAAALSTPEGRVMQQGYSWTVGHRLPGGFEGFWEVFGVTQWNEAGAQAWIADSGVTRYLGANAQVDVRAGRRITAAGPDWYFGFGLAIRQRIR